MSLRLRAKYVLLTFPACDRSKEVALEAIKSLLTDQLEWAIVCEEAHQDGTPHLHVIAAHVTRFQIGDPSYFDEVGGKHGNYKPITRTLCKAVKYVIKDGNYIDYNINAKELIRLREAKLSSVYAILSKKIHAGLSIQDLDLEHGGFMLNHLRKVKEYVDFVEQNKLVEDEKQARLPLGTPQGLGTQDSLIADWIIENVRKPRFLGDLNLWIFGGTGLGKTHLKEQLMSRLRVYVLPYDGNWFDDYADGKYDLMVVDEFKAQYKIQQMNRLLGSEITTLNRRGRPPVHCRDRLPVLVLSNYDVSGCYSKTEFDSPGLVALRRRVVEHFVSSRIDITFNLFPESLSTTEEVEMSSSSGKRAVSDPVMLSAKRVHL